MPQSNSLHPMALNSLIFSLSASSGSRKWSARHARQRNSVAPRLTIFFVRPISSFPRVAPQRTHRAWSATGGHQGAEVQLHVVAGNGGIEIIRLLPQLLAGEGVPHLQGHAGGDRKSHVHQLAVNAGLRL